MLLWFGWGLYVSIDLIREVQLKRWIALYSVTHVQAIYLLWGKAAWVGSIWVLVGMLSHSFISVCLFYAVGYHVDANNIGTVKEIINSRYVYVIGLLLLGNGSFPLTALWLFELMIMTT